MSEAEFVSVVLGKLCAGDASFTEESIRGIFRYMDVDSSGSVSVYEFAQALLNLLNYRLTYLLFFLTYLLTYLLDD